MLLYNILNFKKTHLKKKIPEIPLDIAENESKAEIR